MDEIRPNIIVPERTERLPISAVKLIRNRGEVKGITGLVTNVIGIATKDYLCGTAEESEDAAAYFMSEGYQVHLELLGMPLDYLPEKIMKSIKKQKKHLIKTLATNQDNPFSTVDLASFNIEQLHLIRDKYNMVVMPMPSVKRSLAAYNAPRVIPGEIAMPTLEKALASFTALSQAERRHLAENGEITEMPMPTYVEDTT